MEYFYVKPDDIGSETEYKISIDDINYLSLFATTLEPLPEVTESIGYVAALNNYYSQNTDDYSECYHNLVSSSYGKTFLNTSVQLELLEKQFRKSGLNENSLQAYEKTIQDYQHQVEFNQSMLKSKHSK